MARKKHHRNKGGFTLPLAALAGFAPVVSGIWERRNSLQSMADFASYSFTGYIPSSHVWNIAGLKNGLLPVAMGILAHKIIGGKLGVNRLLARAGIPIFRI